MNKLGQMGPSGSADPEKNNTLFLIFAAVFIILLLAIVYGLGKKMGILG